MPDLRQAAGGLIYAVLSIVLVLGSLSIALAERNPGAPSAATSTTSPVPPQTDTAVPTESSASETASPVEASAVPPATTSAPTLMRSSSTPAIAHPTVAPTRRVPTSTHAASIACGPLPGWVKAYVVQPGDSMFHIATLYRTTVTALQRANCKTSYLIFAGEKLWVPNVMVATPGVTIIPPFFDTPTDEPTSAAIQTPMYFTATPAPTDTATADP